MTGVTGSYGGGIGRWTWPMLALALAMLTGLWLAGPANAAPGTLDSSFSADGKQTTDFPGEHDVANDIALQADGKIVTVGTADVSGTNEGFALARYNPDGTLDTTFSDDGMLTTDFSSGRDRAYGVAIQPDGKIVAVGEDQIPFQNIGTTFAIARYNPDGSLDTTFDGDGKVTTSLGFDSYARDVEILPDGRIVVAGNAFQTSAGSSDDDFALARYNADGSLDTSFSGDGKQTTDFGTGFGDFARALTVQADGKMVVAGYTDNGGTTNSDFAMARYNADGSLDTTFSGDGRQTTNYAGSFDEANDVAMQGNKIIVAGEATPGSGGRAFGLARYNADGTLDSTFSGDGKAMDDFGLDAGANGVRLQPDGKIVAAGYAFGGNGGRDFGVARFTSGGALDPTFSGDGKLTTDFGQWDDTGNALAMQADGKIVVAGDTQFSNPRKFALARYYGGDDTRPPSGSIKINGGAAYTRSTAVKLTLSATDPAPGSGVTSMRFMNDGGAWTAWQPYAATKSWTLRNANGVRTVSVQYRDGVENVSTFKDTIGFDTIKPTISGMTPRHRSTTSDTTPTIKAVVKDNLTNLAKGNITLYVAGKKITRFSYSASTDRLTYTSPRLPAGRKTVKIVAKDGAGNVGAKSWYFTIK